MGHQKTVTRFAYKTKAGTYLGSGVFGPIWNATLYTEKPKKEVPNTKIVTISVTYSEQPYKIDIDTDAKI